MHRKMVYATVFYAANYAGLNDPLTFQQMSSYASLFTFEREFGVRSFMPRDEMQTLKNFFSPNEISQKLKVLEDYLPNWDQCYKTDLP